MANYENIYLFAYGSLMSIESAKKVIKKEIFMSDLIQAELSDYERTWTAKEFVFSHEENREIAAAFLDLKYSPGNLLNGVLYTVDNIDLDRLKKREKNYDCIEIVDKIVIKNCKRIEKNSKVFTFISKNNFKIKDDETNIFVMKKYKEMVIQACNAIGENFLKQYLSTTGEIKFDVISGDYYFLDLDQTKLV